MRRSATYAIHTINGKNENVTTLSHTDTIPGLKKSIIKYSQMYANIEKVAVTKNTRKCLIRRISCFGTHIEQIAMIVNKLKAALPTIVPFCKSDFENDK